MTNNYITGAVIKELREKKGLTQEELAEKIYAYCNKDGLFEVRV